MDELSTLEEKVEKLISLVSELKQRVEDLEEQRNSQRSRDKEVKANVDGLIEKIDHLLI